MDEYPSSAHSHAGTGGRAQLLRATPREAGSDSSSAPLPDAHSSSCQLEISLLCACLHHAGASTAGLHPS